MSKRDQLSKGYNLYLLLSLLLFTLLAGGCNKDPKAQAKENETQEEILPVEAAGLIRGTVTASWLGATSLTAKDEAQVVAEADGVIQKIFVEEGQKVRAGQLLAKLDDRKAALELRLAHSKLKNLAGRLARSKKLYNENLVSAESHEEIQTDVDMQRIKIDLVRLDLANTEIKAPIDGVVTKRLITTGNMVRRHQATFTITDFDPIHAPCHVPENQFQNLAVGQEVHLSIDALADGMGGEPYEGKILRINPVVDADTGTFKVTVKVDNPDSRLKPGLFARVRIIHDRHANVLMAPKDAVLMEGDQSFVFTVTENHTAVKTAVQLGYEQGTLVEVEGLKAEDRVVTTGLKSLKQGSRVKLIEVIEG
jgi:membrane fusion protein (multidrug efflux system)